jgi:hypothetical protein
MIDVKKLCEVLKTRKIHVRYISRTRVSLQNQDVTIRGNTIKTGKYRGAFYSFHGLLAHLRKAKLWDQNRTIDKRLERAYITATFKYDDLFTPTITVIPNSFQSLKDIETELPG